MRHAGVDWREVVLCPLEDFGYMTWTWCISSKRTVAAEKQAKQVRILADAYGLDRTERDVVIDCLLEHQSRNARFWAEHLAAPETAPADTDVINILKSANTGFRYAGKDHLHIKQERGVNGRADSGCAPSARVQPSSDAE
jgi:hypothetical protein